MGVFVWLQDGSKGNCASSQIVRLTDYYQAVPAVYVKAEGEKSAISVVGVIC